MEGLLKISTEGVPVSQRVIAIAAEPAVTYKQEYPALRQALESSQLTRPGPWRLRDAVSTIMSATPINAGAETGPPQLPPHKTDTQVSAQSAQDALQVLLAFACIHEQAVQRRQSNLPGSELATDEYFGLDDVLQLVAARAIAITGADGVAIALARDNAIVCRAAAGRITPDPGIRLDPNSGFSGACLRSGQTVRCDDSETDPRVNPQVCRVLGARSMVAVPLSAKGKVIGLIEAFSSETFGFNDSDVKSLNLLGELILAAIHPKEEDHLAQLAQSILPQPRVIDLRQPHPEPRTEAATPAIDLTAAVGALIEEKLEEKKVSTEKVSAAADSPAPAQLPVLETFEPLVPRPALNFPEEKRSVSRVLLVTVLVLVACGLGGAWFRRAEQLTIASTRAATLPSNPLSNSSERGFAGQPPVKPGVNPEIVGIRHWSSAESSTVVVDLQDQIQYEAHTLSNPSRIYFDLYDTKMAAGLLNQSILVDDTFVKRLRMAQPKPGITRVVLETKGISEVSVKLDPNPYRLTIDVHKIPATPAPATLSKASPFTPSPSLRKPSPVPSAPNSEFRVVLDAGHGGWDLGTVGRKGLLEKDLVLDIVQRLGKLIEDKLAADVIYTRTADSYLSLEKRAEIANLAKADLFLSVHANYSDLATARGVETYYTTTYSSVKARTAEDDPTLKDVNWTGVDIREKVTNSHWLADDVQQALYAGLAARNPDIRNRGVKEAQYVVLTGTLMPAILAEVSFVSSPSDEDNLQSAAYRQQIAEALYRGVAKYRSDLRHTKMASAKKTTNSE